MTGSSFYWDHTKPLFFCHDHFWSWTYGENIWNSWIKNMTHYFRSTVHLVIKNIHPRLSLVEHSYEKYVFLYSRSIQRNLSTSMFFLNTDLLTMSLCKAPEHWAKPLAAAHVSVNVCTSSKMKNPDATGICVHWKKFCSPLSFRASQNGFIIWLQSNNSIALCFQVVTSYFFSKPFVNLACLIFIP